MKLFKTKEEDRVLKMLEDVESIYKITEEPRHVYFTWFGKDHTYGTIKAYRSKEDALDYFNNSVWTKDGNELEWFYLGTTGKDGWLTLNIDLPGLDASVSTVRVNQNVEEII